MIFYIDHALFGWMSVYLVNGRIYKRNVFDIKPIANCFQSILNFGFYAVVYYANNIGIRKLLFKPVKEIAYSREHKKEAVVSPIGILELSYGSLTPTVVRPSEDKKCVYSVLFKKSLFNKLFKPVYE